MLLGKLPPLVNLLTFAARIVPDQLVQHDDLRERDPHLRLHDRHGVGQLHRHQVRRQDRREEEGQQGPHHGLNDWRESENAVMMGQGLEATVLRKRVCNSWFSVFPFRYVLAF